MKNSFQLRNFRDFCDTLLHAGFSMGGGNSDGIFSVLPFNWENQDEFDTPIRWHTGDPETDPWEWRIRVLDERDDIAYGKLFFNKSGYITKEWYSYFLAARRGGRTFEQDYGDGAISHYAKRIYDLFAHAPALPLHDIKSLGGFSKEEKGKFDKALTELQMKLFLTICGRQQKLSQAGVEYGWSSTAFCTTEHFFGPEVFASAAKLTPADAYAAIEARIYALNPEANGKKIKKFILG